MKALIFQTMLALLIPGLSDTPKTLLTPPSAYDFSLVSTPSTEYLTHEWTYGTPTYRYPLDLTKVGGNNFTLGVNGGFTWNNTIYSIENSFAVATIKLVITTPDVIGIAENVAVWGSNYVSQSRITFTIDNFSSYPIYMYTDISSNIYSGSIPVYPFYNGGLSINANYSFNKTTLNAIFIPSFCKIDVLINTSLFTNLDALYFDVISPSSTFQGYEDYITDEAFNSGYNDGYTTAYDEFGNFDWLSSLFTTMGDLLAIEILPGITIGLILLIPIVFGVLRFIMGLFR